MVISWIRGLLPVLTGNKRFACCTGCCIIFRRRATRVVCRVADHLLIFLCSEQREGLVLLSSVPPPFPALILRAVDATRLTTDDSTGIRLFSELLFVNEVVAWSRRHGLVESVACPCCSLSIQCSSSQATLIMNYDHTQTNLRLVPLTNTVRLSPLRQWLQRTNPLEMQAELQHDKLIKKPSRVVRYQPHKVYAIGARELAPVEEKTVLEGLKITAVSFLSGFVFMGFLSTPAGSLMHAFSRKNLLTDSRFVLANMVGAGLRTGVRCGISYGAFLATYRGANYALSGTFTAPPFRDLSRLKCVSVWWYSSSSLLGLTKRVVGWWQVSIRTTSRL